MAENYLGLDSDYTSEEYRGQEAGIFVTTTVAGTTAVTDINGLTGPTITFSGGTTGYSFSSAGTTLTLTGAATKITESGGPTTLTIGAIANGEYAKRVGSTLVGAALSGAPDPIYTQVSPATITADQNDYSLAAGGFYRLATDASRIITGFAAESAGEGKIIANVGANDLVISNQNVLSAAGNRVVTGTGGDVTYLPDEVAFLIYDGTSAKWRLIV